MIDLLLNYVKILFSKKLKQRESNICHLSEILLNHLTALWVPYVFTALIFLNFIIFKYIPVFPNYQNT